MKMKTIKLFLALLIIIIIINGCNPSVPESEKLSLITNEISKPFINPPLANVNIAFEKFMLNAKTGDTIISNSGSKIFVPPNAFLDKEGNTIQGEVAVRYREFSDPLDFFISGIPMTYDSGGVNYTFESAGMCEVLAFQNGKDVFVNPQSKPTVSLVSKNSDPAHNLYYLDSTKEQWLLKGKSEILITKDAEIKPAVENIKSKNKVCLPKPIDFSKIPDAPVKPIEASGKRPVFFVTVQGVDFIPELKIFKNTQFEVDESEKNYNPAEANHQWHKVEIKQTETEGIYLVVFSKTNRQVSYRVRPVYEGLDYTEAVKVFDEKQNQYEIEKQKLIKERELEIARINKEQEIEAARIAQEWKKQQEKAQQEYEVYKASWDANQRQTKAVNRLFEIERFGIWNCDRMIKSETIDIVATFTNENGEVINISNIALVSKKLNAVFKLYGNNVKVIPNSPNLIWGMSDGKLAYFNYKDFNKSNITHNTKEFTFKMNIYPKEITDYHDVKKILDL